MVYYKSSLARKVLAGKHIIFRKEIYFGKKGHRKENSTIKPEIPADGNQQRIKNASAMNTSKNHRMNQIKKPKGKTIN